MRIAETGRTSESVVPTTSRLFAWPGWRHIGFAVVLGAAFSVWFAVVYGAADSLTGLRTDRVRIHFDAERAIPFVPAMVIFYMTIYPLFWCSPFVLRTRRELWALALTLAVVTLIAGGVFLALPAELAYPPQSAESLRGPLFAVADTLNLRYNLFPSLHVALSLTCADRFARKATAPGRFLFRIWFALIAVSTVLTHQHHLLDVAGGVVLGIVGSCLLYPRFADREIRQRGEK